MSMTLYIDNDVISWHSEASHENDVWLLGRGEAAYTDKEEVKDDDEVGAHLLFSILPPFYF